MKDSRNPDRTQDDMPQPNASPRFSKIAAAMLLSLGAAMAGAQPIDGAQTAPGQLQWQNTVSTSKPTARHENGFVAVGKRLYLVGGRGDRPLDIFDPAAGKWTQGAKPPFEIHHMQAVAHDGKLYVLGALTGGFPEETPVANVLIYDPAADRWIEGPEIPAHRRRGGSGVVVHDDRIYIVGGNTRGHMSGFVLWLDAFDPATGKWTELADAPHARDHFHAVVIEDRIYAAGGRRSAHDKGHAMTFTVPELDIYDIAAGRWTTADAPLPTPRAGTASVAVDGKLIVMGGESMAQERAHDEVQAYDPATGKWENLNALPVGRHGTQATVLDSVVHISAGSGNRGGGPELDDLLKWVPAATR